MGPSDTIASLFEKLPEDKSKIGIAVTLGERRDLKQTERDTRLGIVQIAGDITKPSTWEQIESRLYGRKADLIMERAVGGFSDIPDNEKLYAILVNKAWKLLNDQNGMLLAQVPDDSKISKYGSKKWIEFCK